MSYEEWLIANNIANPNSPLHFYDYEGAYKEGETRDLETGHMSSEFKHPLHPTRYLPWENPENMTWETPFFDTSNSEGSGLGLLDYIKEQRKRDVYAPGWEQDYR